MEHYEDKIMESLFNDPEAGNYAGCRKLKEMPPIKIKDVYFLLGC
jgi:hypothetical protein